MIQQKEDHRLKEITSEKITEPSIIDFIRKMRVEKQKQNEDIEDILEVNDDITSTQNLINDARARRQQKVQIFNCDMCDFRSGSETLVKRHKESIHQDNSHPCNHCDYKAPTTEILNRHQNTVHKERTNQCTQGDHTSTQECNLHAHIATTHQEVTFSCDQCDHTSTTEYSLKKHKESSHENQKNNDDDTNKQEIRKKSNYVTKRIQCQKCDKKLIKSRPSMHI